MTNGIDQAIEALENMTARQLRERYSGVFGELTRSGNRQRMSRPRDNFSPSHASAYTPTDSEVG